MSREPALLQSRSIARAASGTDDATANGMATRMAPPFPGDDLDLEGEASGHAPTFPALDAPAAASMAPRGVVPRSAPAGADNEPSVPAPPMGPIYPAPSPWAKPPELRSLLLGLLAAGLLFAGLSLVGVAFAWSSTMTTLAQVALIIVGGYLIALGVAYVVSRDSSATASHV